MLARSFLDPILSDDRLTDPLGDAEARLLIEFLVDEAERLEGLEPDDALRAEVARLCRRGRVMTRVVRLWCHDRQRGAATQLAASEGMAEALPSRPVDGCGLMERLIALEIAHRAA
jgi:hypothetical protein